MFHVYLLCAEINGEKLYKIGYTRRTPEQRIKEFKTGNASEFWLVDSYKSKWGTKIEAQLHRSFKAKKVSGEWFSLSEEDLKTFKEKCSIIDRNLDLITNTNTYYLDRGDF
jgi:hypothetical protein